jgi:hypothetical protein
LHLNIDAKRRFEEEEEENSAVENANKENDGLERDEVVDGRRITLTFAGVR